jgi:hypothetical protein
VRWAGACLLVAYYVVYAASAVYADPPPTSAHYHIDESSIDAGGLIQSSSTNFQASSAIGDLGVGNSASANYQVEAGSKTTNDPALSFAVNTGTADFGSFTASAASTANATFSVLNYTSYGYVVQIAGNAPSNGSHTIPAMATTGASVPGTEQFGINVVANTSPISFGANPDHGQFGFGSASANYGTSNQFRYVSGETIATAPKSSGVTTYTLSYIVNVTSLTPGGQYASNQTLIVTGTY